MKKLLVATICALTFGTIGPAAADYSGKHTHYYGGYERASHWCRHHPNKCAERRANFRHWCRHHPHKCRKAYRRYYYWD